jgi:hypothetical protein
MPPSGAVIVKRGWTLPPFSMARICSSLMPASRIRWRAASTSASAPRPCIRLTEKNSSCAATHSGTYRSTSGLVLAYRVERCANMKPFDETSGTRLHQRDVALVVGNAAEGGDRGSQRPALHLDRADAQVLLDARADRGLAIVGRFIGIHRDQLHVHERRLAGLVEFRSRHHRVMPVEHLALRGGLPRSGVRGCGRTCRGRVVRDTAAVPLEVDPARFIP